MTDRPIEHRLTERTLLEKSEDIPRIPLRYPTSCAVFRGINYDQLWLPMGKPQVATSPLMASNPVPLPALKHPSASDITP